MCINISLWLYEQKLIVSHGLVYFQIGCRPLSWGFQLGPWGLGRILYNKELFREEYIPVEVAYW